MSILNTAHKTILSLFLLGCFLPALQAQDTANKNMQTPDVLGNMINDMNAANRKNTRQSMELNRANQDIIEASTSSDAAVDRAAQQVERAHLEAQSVKTESASQANRTDRDESWSSTISDGVIDGVDSGAALLGGAIGGGINAAAKQKQDK